eukprot:15463698-Alexandrium_andersonii.AAC.1
MIRPSFAPNVAPDGIAHGTLPPHVNSVLLTCTAKGAKLVVCLTSPVKCRLSPYAKTLNLAQENAFLSPSGASREAQ